MSSDNWIHMVDAASQMSEPSGETYSQNKALYIQGTANGSNVSVVDTRIFISTAP
jgi:hypothetical protein